MVDRMAGSNIMLLWSTMLLWSQRDISINFQDLKFQHSPVRCAFKCLWKGSEMQPLAFFKIPRC